MITITEGMTPTTFLEAVNYNFLPATTPLTAVMQGDDFKTNHDANYAANKVTFTNLAEKTEIIVGQRASSFIAALNANGTKINSEFETTYPFSEESHVVAGNKMSAYLGVWTYSLPSILKLANGKTFISCMSKGGVGFDRKNFGVIRDVDGTYSETALIPHDVSTEGTYDAHGRGSVLEKAGNLYFIHEELVGVTGTPGGWAGGHNSNYIIFKSTNGGSSWAELSRFGKPAGAYEFRGVCYPNFILIGTDFYVISRLTPAGGNEYGRYVDIWKSTDDCATWIQLTKPYDNSSSTYWAYNRMPEDSGGEINIVITEWKYITGVWRSICHIRSTDGITYYNSNRSWSKNVVTGGSITRVELLANCLIAGNIDDATQFTYLGGFIKNDKLYCLIGSGSMPVANSTAFTSLKIYENSTILIDISSLLNGITFISSMTSMILAKDNNIFNIFHIDYLDGNKIKKHVIGAAGIISTEVLKAGVADDVYGQQVGGITMNSDRITGRMVVVTKNTGDIMDDSSYADLIIFNNI
jgi:hypothetical protein